MPGRTFRVFVSSTFSDLKAERNALARWVFPRLRALCEARGYKFQAVDLRWGVRDEAGMDQQTVRICLDEIARCQRLSPRPNFIVLLGDRYGWCPPPSVIPAADLDLMLHTLSGDSANLIRTWYRRDDNAVPAEYVLQPRRGKFEDHAEWARVERQLRELIEGAARAAGLDDEQMRDFPSATELEIVEGALRVSDAAEHVFGFFRTISNLDDVKAALPKEAATTLIDTRQDGSWDESAGDRLAALKGRLAKRLGDNVWSYQAQWTGDGLDVATAVGELPADVPPSAGAAAPPPADAPVRPLADAAVRSSGAPAVSEPRTLCEAVWQRLSRVLVSQMDALDREDRDPLDVEKRAHADFGAERRRVFVGRGEPRQRIEAYLKDGAARPLVVHGPSGSGKSALMARAIADARVASPGAVVIERFIGASPGASEVRPLLESVCQEIGREFGGDQTAIGDYPKLVAALSKCLALATPDRPLFVFLDALDQLGNTDDGRRLVWLPRELPPHVRIVVSTLEDDKYQCFSELRAAVVEADRARDFVRIEALSREEGREILEEWLKGSAREDSGQRGEPPATGSGKGEPSATGSGKGEPSAAESARNGPRRGARRLTKAGAGEGRRSAERGQLEILLEKFERGSECDRGSPLYLKLAFEEARRWHSYDGDAPAAALPEDVPGMIRALFARLSALSQHGPHIVSRALGYLAAARYGMSDEELLDLLWRDPDVKAELQEHARQHHRLPDGTDALPPVIWSRLYFDLEPYLTEREIFGVRLLAFYHRQIGEVASDAYLDCPSPSGPRRARVHADLAVYFTGRWQRPDTHALLELIGHLVRAGRESGARALLLEYEWLAKKLAATNIDFLLRDYDELPIDRQEPAGLVGGALRLSSHVLALRPGELASQLLGRMLDFSEPEIRRVMEATRLSVKPPAILPLVRRLDAPGGALLRTLVGHEGVVTAVAVTPDGRKCVSASRDQTLKVWDLATGANPRTLAGHGGVVTAVAVAPDAVLATGDQYNRLRGVVAPVAVMPDGQTCVSVSADMLKFWNLATGENVRTLTGSPLVDGLRDLRTTRRVVTLDGRTCVSSSDEGMLIVWDLYTRAVRRRLLGLSVRLVAVTPDGRTCVSASERELKVWDLATGNNIWTLVGHASVVTAVAVTPDGRMCVSAALDQTLKVWDLGTGENLKTLLAGHEGQVTLLTVTPDGLTCVSASTDKTLKVWDLGTGKLLGRLAGHERGVTAVAVTPDSGMCVSASTDTTLKVWDLAMGEPRPMPAAHADGVSVVAVTTDGRTCISAAADGMLKVWDLATGENLRTLTGHEGGFGVPVVVVAPDGRTCVSASTDKTLKVWDLATGEDSRTLVGHQGGITAVALTADGRTCVSASTDKTLKVWDLATGKNLRTFSGHQEWVGAVAVTSDGRWCVSASADTTVKVWDLATGEELRTVGGEWQGSVSMVAVTPDGLSCVSVAADRMLRVWDLTTGENLRTLAGHQGGVDVTAVVVTPDGRTCVSASTDKTLKVWDLGTGENLRTLAGHADAVGAVVLTPDGRMCVSASSDKTLRVWDLVTGALLDTFTGDASFARVTVTPDGHRVVAGDALGRVHFFDLLLPRGGPSAPLFKPPGAADRESIGLKGNWLRRILRLG